MKYIILILSALITSLTLQYDALWVLSYFAMAPYFCFLLSAVADGRKYRSVYKLSLIWSMIYFMGVYSFFMKMYPMDFMGLSKIEGLFVTLFCWIGLSLLQALPTALVGLLFKALYRDRWLSPLLFASLWTIFEWLQNFTWAGVPFLRLALSQTSMLPAMQSASLFGSLFLSFLVALVNACVGMSAYCLIKNGKQCLSARAYPMLAAALVLLNLGYGMIAAAAYSEDGKDSIPVALIQGNIGSADKWADNSAASAMKKHVELTERAIAESGAKIVLYPETALNFYLLDPTFSDYAKELSRLAERSGAIIFAGTFTQDASKDGIDDYNSIVAFFPDGSIESHPYNKQHLVPFGEYLPMEGFFRTFLPFLDLNLFSSLSAGNDTAILTTEYGNVGRLICFDSIYESLTNRCVRDGGEIILLSTNDSWYLDSAACSMHNDHAKLRAVESGRYILRAANTGISSIIDPCGRSISELGALKEGYVLGSAVFLQSRTVYSYIGDLFMAVCFVLPIWEIGRRIFERYKRNKVK